MKTDSRTAVNDSVGGINSDHFKARVRTIVKDAQTEVRCFLLDAETMPFIDTNGAASLEEVSQALAERGIVIAIAAAKGPVRFMLDQTGLTQQLGAGRFFPTVESLNPPLRRSGFWVVSRRTRGEHRAPSDGVVFA